MRTVKRREERRVALLRLSRVVRRCHKTMSEAEAERLRLCLQGRQVLLFFYNIVLCVLFLTGRVELLMYILAVDLILFNSLRAVTAVE